MNANECMALRDQLLAESILAPAEIDKSLAEASKSATDLETVLRKNHVLTEPQLNALRAMRRGVAFCNLSDFIPRLRNADLLNEELVRRHMMFPLFDFDGVVTLVMENPGDLTGIDQVRRLIKREVDVCMGNRSDILGLIERAYGASKYLGESAVKESLFTVEEDAANNEAQPVIHLVNDLINEAIRQNASDIHIEPGEIELRVRIRVDGVLREIAAPPLGMHRALVSRVKILSRLDIAQTRAPQDGAFSHPQAEGDVVIRVSVLPSILGESVVMRILRNESESITLPELGMQPKMLDRFGSIVSSAHGMMLVSGPTGSGKSTTLYAALKSIASPHKNIIAIEDPVEYRTSIIRQVQVNPEADLTFANGLRSVLRQDPDVIMVGEIRDGETARIAIQAALTGHLVLSTVHTNDSISAIARFHELGIAEYLISSSLLAVLAQRLCRKICPDCKAPDSPPEYMMRALGLDAGNMDFEVMRGKGCRRCVGSGYVGRVGVYELFEVDDQYRAMIVDAKSPAEIRSVAKTNEMAFIVDDGIHKIRLGLTTVEEIVRIAGQC